MKTLADFPSDTLFLIVNGEWDESQHPRAEDGKFTDGGGGSGGSSSAAIAELSSAVENLRQEFNSIGDLSGDAGDAALADLSNKLDRASERFDELSDLSPDDPDLAALGEVLTPLQRSVGRASRAG